MVYKSGQIFLPSQYTRVTDGRTDRRTDRRTEFLSLDRVCIACGAVKPFTAANIVHKNITRCQYTNINWLVCKIKNISFLQNGSTLQRKNILTDCLCKPNYKFCFSKVMIKSFTDNILDNVITTVILQTFIISFNILISNN